jgi:hypothetical protein
VRVRLDRLRGVPPAEHVMAAAVLCVEVPRVPAVQVAHAEVEIRIGRLDDQVVVRAHEAVRMQAPAVAAGHRAEQVEEGAAVFVLAEEEGAAVSDR